MKNICNKISFVIATNGKRYDLTKKTIKSIQNATNFKCDIHIGGNVSKFLINKDKNIFLHNFVEESNNGFIGKLRNRIIEKCNTEIVVYCDDDVLIPKNWLNNFLEYNNNNDWNFLTNKIFLPNGGRYWDRSIIDDNIHTMVDYDHDKYDKRLYFCSTFFVTKRNFFNKFKFDETLKYYGGVKDKNLDLKNWKLAEDHELSYRIYQQGYCIDFDSNNYVFHINNEFTQVIRKINLSKNVCIKNIFLNDEETDSIFVKDRSIINILRNEFKNLRNINL